MFPETFRTARLIGRPIVPNDAGAIFNTYAQDPHVTRFLTWRPHLHLQDTYAYIGHCIAAPRAVFRTYVLTDRETGIIRGALDLRRPEPHRLAFGYVLARPNWGQGLMTEALQHVVLWALAQPPIWRIGAVCDHENIASARVMEKAGLSQEGLLRRWFVHPNIGPDPRDCYSYARVR